MALQPTLKLLSVAENASSIYVLDTTTPSTDPEFDKAGVLFSLVYLDASGSTNYKPSDPSGLYTTGLKLSAGDLHSESKFKDGVATLMYHILLAFVNSLAGQVVFDGNKFSFPNGTDLRSVFPDAVGFTIPSEPGNKIYYIDLTRPLTASEGYVTEEPPQLSNPVSIQLVYEGNLPILFTKNGELCLIKDIAAWSETCCNGDHANIWKRWQYKIAAEAKFKQGLYKDANKLAIKLAEYCNTHCKCI